MTERTICLVLNETFISTDSQKYAAGKKTEQWKQWLDRILYTEERH